MKLHLNLSLRRALLAAMAAVVTLAAPARAGLADERYDLQYYLDFSYNRGMFTAGATNISVFYKDGGSASNPVIAIMPNLDSFGSKGELLPIVGFSDAGGSGLIAPQFLESAAHCGETDVSFVTQNGSYGISYSSTGYSSQGGVATADWSIQRLDKIVTEVAYTPYATDEFMRTLTQNTWMYRVGEGTGLDTSGGVQTNGSAMGGLLNIENIHQKGNNTWIIYSVLRENDTPGDVAPPLQISGTAGDSGSPVYAWDAENQRFVQVGFCSGVNKLEGYNSDVYIDHNPMAIENFMASCTTNAHEFFGTETIIWGTQDTTSGKGMLTQGSTGVEYIGSGSGNTSYDHKGLSFSTEDTTNTQVLELQGSVNMGAGSLSFDKGSWKLTETAAANTFNSAGFIVNSGADLTLELSGASNEEWRKVGEGTMTIAGSGNNEATLRVGGGTTVYNVTYDEAGNVTGCTLGNKGETRLDRTDGYAASSVRLEGGVAILVLMQDGQFKTNSVAGDTFSFGNAGGLLNLNGHDLSWGVINQYGSETGARIGNFTPLGETRPGLATFTYTGTGTFAGCFMDEGADSTAQLAVKYNNTDNGTWTLTGNHTNVGGFTVESGTMVLQGSLTPHAGGMSDANDWTYATLSGSNVTVKDGATFRLSHHALMQGDITVESGGNLVINQTVNADYESIQGSLQQNMHGNQGEGLFNSLVGNVYLNSTAGTFDNPGKVASMVVDTNSSVITTLKGNVISDTSGSTGFVSFTKQGSGIFVVDGQMQVARGTVNEGGLVIKDSTGFLGMRTSWTIGEQGFMAIEGLDNQTAVNCISTGSSGVLALTGDQATELQNLGIRSNLIIGAWGDISYGTADATLSTVTDATYGNVWRLGGGTGTLTVNFKLTGDASLLIGNEWSSGTVHLTNTANDFTGDIYIQGTGNKLTYVDGALGAARVNLTYGNALAVNQADQMNIIKEGSDGVIATSTSGNLDLSGTSLSLGANGTFTYTGTLTVDDTYRFGGSGDLTLDTELSGASSMKIDGQGTEGSSVTFARENAFSGSITAGGGLELAEPNSKGQINIHAGHSNALAAASSLVLNKGAVLHTDGNDICVQNLTANAGSLIRNEGTSSGNLLLRVTEGTSTTIADGVLGDSADTSALHLVKTGKGTLTMATNSSWTGGMTISEGTVIATLSGDGYLNAKGGIGSTSSVINLEKEGTLQLVIGKTNGSDRGKLGSTLLPQTVLGSGTVVLSSGGEALLFSNQQPTFNGTVQLKDNTRLYIGDIHGDINYNSVNNLKALAGSTVVVESGSQAKVTNTHRWGKQAAISTTANFTISGNGYAGLTNWNILASRLTSGALAIDNNSTVYGNITLADDAMISSSSAGTLKYFSPMSGLIPGDTSGYPNNATYGTINHLGGNIRGRILGEGKTLTFGGNEGMTITADSANTFGDLIIASGNGNNDDKFALRLNGGKAESQTSTALGTGKVTINDGLILRLAGTGTANQSSVVYTYANNIDAGNGATIQSHNITNRLTGTVTMEGESLNLATANGGVLELAGGVDGSGTLNLGAASVVVLGSEDGISSRAVSPQFSGAVVAGAAADVTLYSPSMLSASTTFAGTDSLTLRFNGQETYTLGGITVGASGETASSLTLSFDFTQAGAWSSLNSSVSAGVTTIELEMNMFREIAKGNYTLISSAAGNTGDYVLADDMNGRLSLVTNAEGALVLTVDADNRLVWRTDGVSSVWNGTDANWYSDKVVGMTTFSSNADVALNASGVAADNSAEARETISLNDSLQVGSMIVQEAAYEVTGSGAISGQSLAVGQGGDLKLSNTGGNSFTEGVIVNDGSLEVSGSVLTAEVTAENGASFALSENASMNGNLSLEQAEAEVRQSSLNGNINLAGACEVRMDNATLNGVLGTEAGNVTLGNAKLSGDFQSGSGVLQSNSLNILSGSVTSNAALEMGHLTLTNGSLQINAAAAIDKLSIAAGKTVTLWNATAAAGADKVLGIAELGNNAILQTNDREAVSAATTIGTVKLTGTTATVQDVHHSGGYAIHNIEGAADSTLVLAKNATSNNVAVFTLGSATETTDAGSQFAGTILLKQQNASDGKRDVALILNHGTVAQKATINLASAQQSTPKVALGINVAEATIGGLDSGEALGNRAIVFSGNQTANSGWQTPGANAPVNTLTISTAADTTHNFYGQVQNVNLVIDGEGQQNFLGDNSGFSHSLVIRGGTAGFNGTGKSLLTAASSVILDGGTLDLSLINFSDTANAIAVQSDHSFTISQNSVLVLGNLNADTSYQIFSYGGDTLQGWESLTADNFVVNGDALSNLGRVVLNLGMNGSFSYSMADSWDLVWNGGSEKAVWNQSSANQVWLGTHSDLSGDSTITEATGFTNNDNVAFNSDADLVLNGKIRVNNMTVADGISLTTNGSLTITGELNVGDNVSWRHTGDSVLSYTVTEAKLKSFAALQLGEGATLTMTNKTTGQNNTSTAFDNVSGACDVVLNLAADNGVGFNLNNISGDITVATGRLQVNTSRFNEASDIILSTSNSQLVFNGQGTELKNDVVLNSSTTIHANSNCSGTISGTISGSTKTLTKNGAGMLTFSGATTLGGLTVNSGTVKLTNAMTLDGTDRLEMNGGTALQLADGASIKRTTNVAAWIRGNFEVLKDASAEFVSVDDVHLNYDNGNGKGSIVLRENSELTMDVAKLNFYTGADITVHENAELKLTKSNVHISNKGTSEAKITASSVGATSGQLYSVENDKFEVSNAHVKSVAATDTTLGNKLTNSSVENAGGGLMTVNNAANTISGVYATAGDMAVMQQALGMNLNELVVGDGMTVSAYTGTEKTAAAEANLTVSRRAEFGAGATLNANLTLNSGATLEVAAGGLAMGSSLTLNEGITLGTSTLERVYALSVGESTTLFSGVDGLTLGSTSYSSITEQDSILAAPYFSNLNSNNYVLTYTGTDNGSLNITMMTAAVPEPTTATLSLLALAALAARRRRR